MSKFNSEVDEFVYREYILMGYEDEYVGNAQTCTYQASIWVAADDADEVGHGYAILSEDSQGFVDVEYFDSHTEWEETWSRIVGQHAECCLSEVE